MAARVRRAGGGGGGAPPAPPAAAPADSSSRARFGADIRETARAVGGRMRRKARGELVRRWRGRICRAYLFVGDGEVGSPTGTRRSPV
jgi:hypothetical protein